MMDWLGKMLDLPKEFLASTGGKGGGIIQVKTDSHVLLAIYRAVLSAGNIYERI
jgi:aromatic-L-amino-acid decarboxylase